MSPVVGFYDNIPRVLPEGMKAIIEEGNWPVLPIFKLIQEKGQISDYDMYRTFNMGIGMIVVIKAEEEAAVLDKLASLGEQAYRIGYIKQGQSAVEIVGGK